MAPRLSERREVIQGHSKRDNGFVFHQWKSEQTKKKKKKKKAKEY